VTKDQNLHYFALFGAARKVNPTLDRHAMHAKHGLPASHKEFSEADFDEWKSACLAIAKPTNYGAQHKQATMPAARKRWYIRRLLAALEKPEEYAEVIFGRMRKGKKQRYTGAGDMTTLETAGEEPLHDVLVALKQECRRVWPTKADLLGQVIILGERFSESPEAAAAVMEALSVKEAPRLADLVYESLLLVLGTLRKLEAIEPVALDAENIPF
jgi:hypothetical protein